MKANELMIGDWVRINSDINPDDAYWMHDMQPGQALKVTEILSYGINPDWYGGEINDIVPEDAIEPIPLTPEILEKNGFYYDEDRKAYLMGVIFRVKPERYGLFSFGICGCPYPLNTVHQLQHALRLSGIEKEITI